jgi:hypothetical protein
MRRGIGRIVLYTFLLVCSILESKAQTTYFSEGFELGKKPDNWTEEAVEGNVPWRYRNGGYNPADPNLLIPPATYDIFRNPDRAEKGTYNAWFFTQGIGREQTKLITPPINLKFAVSPILKFWLTLYEWRVATGVNNDILRVYYKIGATGGWRLLQTYNFVQDTWRDFQIPLPSDALQKDVYLAFEGLSRWGMGVCLDEIKVDESGSLNRTLSEAIADVAPNDIVPNGTANNPILCSRLKVVGNVGSASLSSIKINALGTNTSDITRVKLFVTPDPTFNTATQIGEGTLSGSSITLTPNYSLPTGYNYLWVTYDIDANAKSGNIIDAEIPASGISINGSTYANAIINSAGTRTIKQNLFFDDFETDKGWALSGDFEIATPLGKKGMVGNPDPSQAVSGTKVLGNDLTHDGVYDANIPFDAPYTATSPKIDATFYKGIVLNFKRWLNIENFDKASIQASPDNGATWVTVWDNSSSYALDDQWSSQSITLPSTFDRKSDIRIRYTLASNESNEFTGWNIDDVSVVGNYVEKDMAATEIVSPTSTCGNTTSAIPIAVRVKNVGSKDAVAPIPVKITINGTTSIDANINENIASGTEKVVDLGVKLPSDLYGDLEIKAQVMLPGDEDASNDIATSNVHISKTYAVPYTTNFDTPEDWVKDGYNWMYGNSTAPNILGDSPTDKMWITDLNGNYENNAKATLTSPCFDIIGFEKPMLEFRTSYVTEKDKDGVNLSYSTDNGNTWQSIGTNGDKWDNFWGWDNQSTIASSGKVGFNGDSNGWVNISHLLPASLNGATSVKFRFEFTSDAQNNIFSGFGLNGFTLKEAPDDFGVTAISKPVTLTGADVCGGFTEAERITFKVKNWGIKKAKAGTAVKVSFKSSYSQKAGGAISKTEEFEETFTLPADLDINAEQEFISTKTIDMNRGGSYDITAKTIDDPENFYKTNNDSFTTNVIVNKPIVDLGPTVTLGDPNPTEYTFNIADYTKGFSYEVKWEKKEGDGNWVLLSNTGDTQLVSATDFTYPNNKISFKVTLTDPASKCNVSSTTVVYMLNPDIEVSKIASPTNACSFTDKQAVTAVFTNKGLDIDVIKAGTILTLGISLNGGTPSTYPFTVPKDIASGESFEYTFPNTFDMSATGTTYELTPSVSMQYDINSGNDKQTSKIVSFGFPAFTLMPQAQTVEALDYTYDADPKMEFKSYKWYDESTDRTNKIAYPGPTDGKLWCTVTDGNGCSTKSDATIKFAIKDLAVKSINNIQTTCTHEVTLKPALTIENKGNVAIPSGTVIPFEIDINGTKTSEDYTLSADLAPGTSADINLNSSIDLSAKGSYTVSITAKMNGDLVDSNNMQAVSAETYGLPQSSLPPEITTRDVDVTLDAGAGFTDYKWSTTDISQSIVVSKDGKYDVKVTDNNGCSSIFSSQVTFIRNDLSVELVSDYGTNSTVCSGNTEYPVTIRITNTGNDTPKAGTIIPATFKCGFTNYSENITLANDLAPNSSIDYTFTKKVTFTTAQPTAVSAMITLDDLTFANNFTKVVTVTVNQTPTVSLGSDITSTGASYTIVPTITPDLASNTYLWNTGAITKTLDVTNPGSYSLTVTNQGCSASDEVGIAFNRKDLSMSSIDAPKNFCFSNEGRNVTITIKNTGLESIPTGTVLPLSYTLKGGNTISETYTLAKEMAIGETIAYTFSQKLAPLAAGDYELSAAISYPDDGITTNNSITSFFTVNALPTFTFPSVTTGNGMQVDISGPANMNKYIWSTGASTQTITATQEGSYSLTVTGANGCTYSQNTQVIFNPDIELTSIVNSSLCQNATAEPIAVVVTNKSGSTIKSGTALAFKEVVNGTLLTNQQTLSADLVPLASATITLPANLQNETAGQYPLSVEVTLPGELNTANNKKDATITVIPSPTFTLPADFTSTNKQEILNGPSGMTSYLWSTGETTSSITVTNSGTYKLTVTNQGCSASDEVAVTFNRQDISMVSVDSPKIFCASNESRDVTVTVKNSGTENIAIGTELTFVYASGSTIVTEKKVLAEEFAIGKTISYTFTQKLTNLTANDMFSATVSYPGDGNELNNTLGNIKVNALPTFTLTNPIVGNSIQVDIAGPASMSKYSWSTGAATQNITATQEGNYSLTVTDANGCSYSQSTQVVFNSDIELTSIINSTLCQNTATEPITVTVTNKSGKNISKDTPLKFSGTINGASFTEDKLLSADLAPQASATITLSATLARDAVGQYPISIAIGALIGEQNISNNKKDATVTVNPSPAFTLPADIVSTNTKETIDGPAGMASYEWKKDGTPFSQDRTITVTQSGTYSLKVTNSNGCSSENSIKVQFKGGDLVLKSIVNNEKICQSSSPVPLSLVIGNDGDMPISKGETITISVKANGTVKTENFVLTEDLLPKSTSTITLTATTGINATTSGTTVAAEVSVSYKYDVNPNNPSVTKTFIVAANPTFSIDIKTVTDKSEATLSATNTNLTYAWSNGASTKDITVYENSVYKATGTNSDGCSLTKEVSVDFIVPVNINFIVVYPTVSQTKCYDGRKKAFEVKLVNESQNTTIPAGTDVKVSCTYQVAKADGTTLEYKFSGTTKLSTELKPTQNATYCFDNMMVQGKQATNMVEEIAGKHSITGYTEVNGKQSAAKTTQFEIYPIPSVNLGNDVIYRPLPSALTINLSSDYSFLWSSGEKTNSIIVNSEGKYWVKVTSKNGCSASDTVEVKQGSEEVTLKLDIYPNPASSSVNIVASIRNNNDITIEIYSAAGVLFESKKFEATTQAEMFNYDINRLESGSYAIIARTKDKKVAKLLQVVR